MTETEREVQQRVQLPDESVPPDGTTSSEPAERHTPARAIWNAFRRYPVPLGSLLLLALSLILWLARQPRLAQWVLLAIILAGGIPLAIATVRQLLRREFSIDLIAILAIGGSLALGEYVAGALVVLMLSGGEALEAYALRRASSSLSALAERMPRTAHIWREGRLVTVPAETVEVNTVVVVKPGEVIPVDGEVMDGESSVSEADLTGEPVPARKVPGTTVLSGSVNLDGVLQVHTRTRSAESKYAQILRLVREAQQQKAPIHRLADRYAVGFTAGALSLAGLAWLLSGDSLYALAVLVVATPCPLILATPIAIMSGIDLAARNGIIIKSGAAIEQLGEVNVTVFDKTGTLTLGTPALTEVVLVPEAGNGEPSPEQARDLLLALSAAVDQYSAHVLARAVVAAAHARELPLRPVLGFTEAFGQGASGRVVLGSGQTWPGTREREVTVAVGNRSFMRRLGVALPEAALREREQRIAQGQLASFVAVEGRVCGLLVLADVPRAELARLAPDLRAAGIQQTVLLTGDSDIVAQQIGQAAQMDRIVSRCLPDDKVRVVRELEASGHRVLMVGDGINDAPALATATVGMALGAQGLTAAASAADTVLLSTDILRVPKAVRLGRRVLRIARHGIWVGMGLSGVAMLFAAFGFIPPAAGAILQEGIDVIVILNALRAGREEHPTPPVAAGLSAEQE
jgi:heavy metal translocating P-type ATPase